MGDERDMSDAFMHWFYGGTPPSDDARYIDAVVEMPSLEAPPPTEQAAGCGACAHCPRARQTASLLRASPAPALPLPAATGPATGARCALTSNRRTPCSSGL